MLWSIVEKDIVEINTCHTNTTYFGEDVKLSERITATGDLAEAVTGADYVVLAVPSGAIRSVLTQALAYLGKDATIVNLAKGFDPSTRERMSCTIYNVLGTRPNRVVTLIGPSHAEEVVARKITSVCAVSEDAATAEQVQKVFSGPYFRLYVTTDVIGAEYIRDVKPGEIVTLDHHGIRSQFYAETKRHAMCAMEYVYFARPDSDIEGCNVHNYRKESGKILFQESPVEADIVIGVPDSSLSAAQGYAEASGLPYEMGLIKSKYVGRTFILPTQALREKGVKMKLSPVKSIVKGKRIVLVDDSIVRGTTSLKIVNMLREAGAKEVHVRIASAPLKYTCFYGVDVHTPQELISNSNDVDQVCKLIGADTLAFLSHEGMYKAGKRNDLCLACFNHEYPTELYD